MRRGLKRITSWLLVVAILIALVPVKKETVYADLKIGNFNCKVLSDWTMAITGYTDYSTTDLVIPDKLGEYTVTRINDSAFQSHSELKSVTIPESVYYIGNSAFSSCYSLETIVLPDTITHIGSYAFKNTAYYNNTSNWKQNILYLGPYLIASSTELGAEYRVLPGTKCIGTYAFFDCDTLKRVILPDGVANICAGAFSNCENLKEINIPDSITAIEAEAFSNCSSLSKIALPDKAISIGSNAFNNTAYSNNIANWSDNVLYLGSHLLVSDIQDDKYQINNGTKSIAGGAFYYPWNLKYLLIPDSVTNIPSDAFAGTDNVVLYVKKDSYAEQYAKDNYMDYLYDDLYPVPPTPMPTLTPDYKHAVLDYQANNDGTYTMWVSFDSDTDLSVFDYGICHNGIKIISSGYLPDFAIEYGKNGGELNTGNATDIMGTEYLTFSGSSSEKYICKSGKIIELTFSLTKDIASIMLVQDASSISEEPITNCPVLDTIRLGANYSEEGLLGDVNKDGYINATDALLVLKQAAKLIEISNVYTSDVTKDSMVDAKDALQILKYAANIIDEF